MMRFISSEFRCARCNADIPPGQVAVQRDGVTYCAACGIKGSGAMHYAIGHGNPRDPYCDKPLYRGPNGKTPVFQSRATATMRMRDLNRRRAAGTAKFFVHEVTDTARLEQLGYTLTYI